MLLDGLKNTIIITLGALLIGIVLGTAVAVIKFLAEEKPALKPLAWLCNVYVTVVRGVPVVVLLLIFYFVILRSADGIVTGIVGFGINSGAYMAEIIRGGIMAVDEGQNEAGRSLGLNFAQTMLYIIIPQALKNVLPALANEFIVLLKETSVACYVAVNDLTKGGEIIRSQTYIQAMPLLIVAALYLIMVVFFSHLVSKLERRLRSSDH